MLDLQFHSADYNGLLQVSLGLKMVVEQLIQVSSIIHLVPWWHLACNPSNIGKTEWGHFTQNSAWTDQQTDIWWTTAASNKGIVRENETSSDWHDSTRRQVYLIVTHQCHTIRGGSFVHVLVHWRANSSQIVSLYNWDGFLQSVRTIHLSLFLWSYFPYKKNSFNIDNNCYVLCVAFFNTALLLSSINAWKPFQQSVFTLLWRGLLSGSETECMTSMPYHWPWRDPWAWKMRSLYWAVTNITKVHNIMSFSFPLTLNYWMCLL